MAAALLHDPGDPRTFTGMALADLAVADLCRRVRVTGKGGFASAGTTRTTIELRDGRSFSGVLDDVPGMPFTAGPLDQKFLALTTALGPPASRLLARIEGLEHELKLDWLDAGPAESAHGVA